MQSGADLIPVGAWVPGRQPPAFSRADLVKAIERVREPVHVVREGAGGRLGLGFGGSLAAPGQAGALPLMATLPALYPEWLGDRGFCEAHGVRFPYIAGEMANGIASAAMVIAMGKAHMLGFFGAGGLLPARIEREVVSIREALGPLPWGANLIHAPHEPAIEDATTDIFLRHGVRNVCASAYMDLTPSVVRYAVSGLTVDTRGQVRRVNHLFAKISRPEVARRFLMPAPAAMLQALVAQGKITALEAELATRVPLAEDITVEGDSGGHTDNRPLVALLPTIQKLAAEIAAQQGYTRPIRVGAAGGLGAPGSVAAAFSLGAAYVLTGSVNQASVEAGISTQAKEMLTQADIADVIMAPAADMFELGVKLQVLRRGTMFAVRAQKLYDLYSAYPSLDAIPAEERANLERTIFRAPLDEIWQQTRRFFEERDPHEVERAETDPKHKMALVCRWYLGKSSRWAIDGDTPRRPDYQVWCGPAMGAFNQWVKGSFLEPLASRTVEQIARNLMEGAAVITRAQQLRSYGVAVPPEAFDFRPRPLG
ncbi:MAG: PfaD family polyunsaturated fatty acid/polyketide biosynthesis protein [Polyangiaceae bacterium]|jgi:PfaD family protein|nr:PfaD family polyunsaturated fatty acid/polyketide biosynthesis protein [Polyangiaceae bacterium]